MVGHFSGIVCALNVGRLKGHAYLLRLLLIFFDLLFALWRAEEQHRDECSALIYGYRAENPLVFCQQIVLLIEAVH